MHTTHQTAVIRTKLGIADYYCLQQKRSVTDQHCHAISVTGLLLYIYNCCATTESFYYLCEYIPNNYYDSIMSDNYIKH